MELLIRGGADVGAIDVDGFTPLTLLCHQVQAAVSLAADSVGTDPFEAFFELACRDEQACPVALGSIAGLPSRLEGWRPEPLRATWSSSAPWPEEEVVRLAALLLAAGADPREPDLKGRTVAAPRGWRRFATLCEHYKGAQACHVLLRAETRLTSGPCPNGFTSLPKGIVGLICGYVVPAAPLRRIATIPTAASWG